MLVSLQNQDLPHANKYFKRALREDDDAVLLDLAAYLEQIGFFPQAKEIYLKLADLYPECHLNLALIFAEEGDAETAFSHLDEIEVDSDLYLQALLVKADLYQMEGLADVARLKLVEASQLSQVPAVIFGLAELDFELENYKTAIQGYASLDHQDIYESAGVSTYQRIGLAYARLGKFEAAIEFLEKSVELAYEDATLFELAALLFEQANYQKAKLYFKQLATLNPDFEGYEWAYASSLHAEHLTEQALEVAKAGLAKNPFDTALLLLASQLAYELHDAAEAERYLKLAEKDAEDLNDIALRLTNLYLEQARYQEVLAYDREDVEHLLARWNVAKAYQHLERLPRAKAVFEELEVDLKDNPEFLQDFIQLLQEMGLNKQVKPRLRHYLHLVPDDLMMQELYHQI